VIVVERYAGPKESNHFYDCGSNNTECSRVQRDAPDRYVAVRNDDGERGRSVLLRGQFQPGHRWFKVYVARITREIEGD